jgi:DUF1680 family protein
MSLFALAAATTFMFTQSSSTGFLPLSDVKLLGGPFEVAHQNMAKYLLELDTDRLLAGFRANSGIKSNARIYGGWETGGLSGHSLGHYLTACAQEFRRTGDVRFKEKMTAIVAGLKECQESRGDGFLSAFRFNEGFDRERLEKIWAEVASGNIRSGGFDLNGMWAPWYVHHKILVGLIDVYTSTGNKEALAVADKFGQWALDITKDLTDSQWQQMLGCEYGGMNEVLAELSVQTGRKEYLALARKFYDNRVLNPIKEGKDELAGKHSNTQIPKILGLAKLYNLEKTEEDRKASEFFWNRVVNHHTYAIGGNSNGEYFGPPDEFAARLSSNTCETCNTYNMLRLTQQLFAWDKDVKRMEYYERAYFNHILASQDPDTGGVTYFMPLASGSRRHFSSKTNDFTCCHGTGMENHTKHADSVYFEEGGNTLYVNLFMPTEVNWRSGKLKIRQETEFPLGNTVKLEILEGSGERELKVRHPEWSKGTLEFLVNGKVAVRSEKPGYVSIKRTWKKGDTLEFALNMSPWIEEPKKPGQPKVLLTGPIVLGADLGPANGPVPRTPVLVTGGKDVSVWLKPVPQKPGQFRVWDEAKPEPLVFKPFYQLSKSRYAVYFDFFSEEEWAKAEAEYRAEEARMRDLEARTVDQTMIGQMQPERDHNLTSERNDVRDVNGRNYRTPMAGGWFEFEMKVDGSVANELVMTYWGNDRVFPEYTILVDGEKLVEETMEGAPLNKFFDRSYKIPESLTKGKQKVKIRVQAKEGKWGPSTAGARIVRVAG